MLCLQSDFYTVNDVKNGKQIIENLFGTKSNSFHDQQVKPIQRHYTMNSLLDFEPLVDKTIGTFTQKLDSNFVETGKICSIDDWLLYCRRLSFYQLGLPRRLTVRRSCVGCHRRNHLQSAHGVFGDWERC